VNTVKKTILIVDDEEIVVDTLKGFLDLLGHKVDSAENGEAALTALAEVAYDFAFVDLNLPGIDGFELLKQISESWPRVRVCIITGYLDESQLARAKGLGAIGALSKPFRFSEIEPFLDDTQTPGNPQL
jgi:CheY-like chemotaxis protein